jgi:hypothetical protein
VGAWFGGQAANIAPTVPLFNLRLVIEDSVLLGKIRTGPEAAPEADYSGFSLEKTILLRLGLGMFLE